MPRRTAVAIYARISQDRDGNQLAVSRQLADCRAKAAELDWTVAEEYVDDDVSAWSGKTRPAYQRMLDDLRAGRIDAVLAWHLDRLYRRPLDLEEFIAICTSVGVTDLRTVSGSMDLATGDGMLVARMLSAVAANESDSKRRRGQRKAQEIAESGQPHMGGPRPFGFEADNITHNPAEAAVFREMAARALAGESLASLGRWLDEEGIRTVTGRQWRTQVVRQVLTSRRMCGIRTRHGQEVGPAVWEPIITVEQSDALIRMLTAPERRTNRTARRYLLSGLCRCDKCGNLMYSMPRAQVRRYVCRSGVDFGGCGGLTVAAEGAEMIVAEAVLIRLDSPALYDAIAGRVRDDEAATGLYESIDADTQRLAQLMDMWTDGTIGIDEFKRGRARLEQRRAQARKDLNRLAGTQDLENYVGHGESIRAQWSSMNLDRQRAVVKTLVASVTILPGVPGSRSVAVERIRPEWRF